MQTKEAIYDEADRLKNAGQNEEAVAKLLELTAQEPDYALAHSALAVLYTRLKRSDEAIRHALRVCEIEPNDAFGFTALSVTYQRAGKIREAEDAMAQARSMSGH